MLEIRCNNVTGFNEATQDYQTCNQKIRLSKERIGTEILCPKCKQTIQVRPETSPVHSSSLDQPIQSRPDVMSMEFTQQSSRATNVFQNKKPRCPKCGGQYNDFGVCETCGYVEPVQDAKRRQKSEAPLRPAGFQLWLSTIANEGVSMPIIGYTLFGGVCFFCLLVIVWSILTTSLLGSAVAAMMAFVLLFTVLVFIKTRQLANQRNAELGVLAPFWNLVLLLARWQKWQNYDGNLRNRTIVDKREHPINDQELTQLDLSNCSVLDLENSDVTDSGLKCLYGLTRLQCLVLKNTRVTAEAVTTLQQHYPRLWIWI